MTDDVVTNQADEIADLGADDGAGVAEPDELGNTEIDPDSLTEETPEAAQDDDTEEIERDGKKFRIPKELKGEFLMNADYTRKTQELSEMRRAVESERAHLAQTNEQYMQARVAIHSIDQQLQHFQQVDWQALNRDDPVQAQSLWMQFSQLKDARQQAAGAAQQMENQRTFEMQRHAAKLIEEGTAVLKRDLPNWGPELAQKINAFAANELGFKPAELAAISDPRVVKALHAAMVGYQVMAKQQQAAKSTNQVPVKPVGKVGANAPAKRDMAAMSTDDWMKARNEQLRKSKGR